MIRVHKNRKPSKGWSDKATRLCSSLKSEYDADPVSYRNGSKICQFDQKVYGAKAIKTLLRDAQHQKCAFCETLLSRSWGDVEHFRPKGGVTNVKTGAISKPGYYWLAYEFSNLYFSCEACNQRFKKNFFPLKNEQNRARHHNDDLALEKPLLVDPGVEDPDDCIIFKDEMPVPHGSSERGAATIELLGLDDELLNEDRRQAIKPYLLLVKLIRSNRPERAEALGVLQRATERSHRYAGMFRSLMKAATAS